MAVASASSGPVVHSKIFLAQYILTRQEEKPKIFGGGEKSQSKKAPGHLSSDFTASQFLDLEFSTWVAQLQSQKFQSLNSEQKRHEPV
jgi:hypothetical protein